MMDIIVNLADGTSVFLQGITKGVQEATDAVRMIYPTWTSLVITLVNTKR